MKLSKKNSTLGFITVLILVGLFGYSNCGETGGEPGVKISKNDPMVTVWLTTVPDESITLPLRQGYEYNMMVDWGDGSARQQITSWNDDDKTHEYAEAGEHTVTLKGLAEAWYFNNNGFTNCNDPGNGSEDKIIEVTDLGEMGWKSLERAFCGCDNLVIVKGGNTSSVTNLAEMFKGAVSAEPRVADWDTSKVTNMRSTFSGVTYEDLDVTNWDTSSATDMSFTFETITADVNISHWDVSKVTTTEGMFLGAGDSNANVSNLNTVNVTNMRQMFYLSGVNPNMSNWNFANVTNMQSILVGCAITTRNYTDALIRMHETRTVNGVFLDATAQYYDSAATARASLVGPSSWNISDNGSAGADPG